MKEVLMQNLLDFIVRQFPQARHKKITEEDSLLRTGIVDSLGVLELVTHLAETYGIEITEEDLVPENFDSVKAICRLVERKRNGH
ncbi:MAG: acyl carrier protein [Desulfosoma sp.]